MEQTPIRIAQIIGKVVMGGVDSVVMNYYRHIDKTKFQFDFFMDGYEDTFIDDEIRSLGGRIFKLPPYEDGLIRNLRAFRKIVNENNYKIVHCHMNTLSIFWLREAKKAGVPIRIAHSHSTASKGEFIRNIIKFSLRPFSKIYANQYCACSLYAGQWLYGSNFYNSGKVNYVKNAIDTDKFFYSEINRNMIREELNLNGKFVIGHIGRFVYAKNHEFLVNIFIEICKLHSNSILLLIGDGPKKEKIENLIKKKKMHDKVIFTGLRTDIPKIMHAMDCFILPSRYEGLPIVVIEAQTSGLPCFISDKISPEIFITKQCIKINLDTSPESWAKCIMYNMESYKRASFIDEISTKGYNIKFEFETLEKLYQSF